MKNREEIIKEYFQLRVFLNKANSRANEKTDLYFEIRRISRDELEFIVKVRKGPSSPHLVLTQWKTDTGWRATENTQFPVLVDYLMKQLKILQNVLGPPLDQSFSKIEDLIAQNLRSLGFEKF